MAKSVNLQVITPSKLFYEGDIELVITRTLTGEEGFMAGHSWACKLLDVGELLIQEAGVKEFKTAAVSGGFIDVKKDIVIYTDAAEWAGDIDVERAHAAKERDEEWLAENKDAEGVDAEILERTQVNLSAQKIRLKVADGGSRKKK